jgi:cytochrome c peroxidase
MRAPVIAAGAVAALVAVLAIGMFVLPAGWSEKERETIQSLALANLPALPPDPSNAVADDPAAAALGKALFFDTRLSSNGEVACASCHKPDQQFQDGLPVGHGVGIGGRRTMPIAGTAYFPFLFWDGRKDSQWSQALGPLENPVEHGADRTMVVRLIAAAYRPTYEAVFGPLPDLAGLPKHAMPAGSADLVAAWARLSPGQQENINRVYANIGKAIAAFERAVPVPATRFDAYAAALAAGDDATADSLLTAQEQQGLKLFLGKANCATCHQGPLLTDDAFHNIGLPKENPATDNGRSSAVAVVQADPFNCLGAFSDAEPSACGELKFIAADDPKLLGAFRTPSLRGVAQRAPFMHAGQFATLHELLVHYNNAPAAAFGTSELKPLGLTDEELATLEAFLKTLDAAPPSSNSGIADVN